MLRDKIVFTVTGKLQELLLREDNLTLDKAVKICRAFEQSNRKKKEFRESTTLSSSSTSVNKITQNSETKTPGGKKGSQMNKTSHKGREKLKFNCKFCELDRLVNKGVLVPVTEATEWVSQMAVVCKPHGKLRICIDPHPLNAALKREHYRLPVLDDVLPKFKDAKIFSKLDVKEAYWHVRLDEASSKLTTMITPFGRYMWKRLPFGLKVSSEIFQRKIDEALGDLDGVFNIVDDVVIVVCGNSDGCPVWS